MSAVRPGYKQTEAGVIPDDWEINNLGQVAIFLDSQRRPVKDVDRAKMRGEYPYYGAAGIIDYVNDYLFDDDLVLIGEDGENILSRNLPVAFKVSGKAWVNNHAHVLKAKPNVDNGFLAIACAQLNLAPHNSGTAQPKINKATCERLVIPLPPLPEQQAIAEALGDADALIDGLEALIAKKRDIKQGAMQDLLTGQRRLPGFQGEWAIKPLRALVSMKSGKSITAEAISDTQPYPCYGGNGRRGYADSYTHDGDYILIGRQGALCGNVTRVSGKFFASEHAIVVTCFQQSHPDLLALILDRLNLNRLSESSAQPGLSVQKLLPLEVKVPSTLNEQRVIAAALSDMETEIAALEDKLAKGRAVKQGMMQVLLTGEIRLI